MLYDNGLSGIAISFIASSALAYSFKDSSLTEFKFIWWLCMSAVLLLRITDTAIWRWSSLSQNGKLSVYRFITGTFLTAGMWCVYGIVVLLQADIIELVSTVIILSAMAGGAATVLSAHRITSVSYAIILLAPSSITLLLGDESHHHFLGFLGLGFCSVMAIVANKAATFTAQAITLKNENAVLVNHMEEKVEQRTREIYELSNIDPLSKLLNRAAFTRHLGLQLDICEKENTSLALLFIDLDNFKKINDTLGHEVGDQLLSRAAERLKQFISEQEFLCRWGGDEFLVALPSADEVKAKKAAEALINLLSAPYVFSSYRLTIGATVGIAMHPRHTKDSNHLIQLADTAMYYCKKNASGTAGFFSDDLGEQLFREQMIKEGLSTAIELEQFRLNFQPIVCAKSRKIKAFEALLRWQFRDDSIPPSDFIPIAEQYGLIRDIGQWVLGNACKQAMCWQQEQPISVSVNVSIIQLNDEDFIDIVNEALKQSGLPPALLHIEITESVFASDKKALLRRIRALQAKGIQVSVDDFGTGYSSLSVIQDVKVNLIKIDRSFVKILDNKGIAIINAVLQIASTLEYQVVAEGIETEYQANLLADMNVDFLQGYYFSKPMESEKVIGFIQDYQV